MTDTTARGGMTLEQLRQRREEILQVAAAHGASNIRVFGSVETGGTNPSSDVDVLVDLTTDADGFAYFGVLEELRQALRSMSVDKRLVLVLHWYLDLPAGEIAAITGITLRGVETRLLRATNELRKRMEAHRGRP